MSFSNSDPCLRAKQAWSYLGIGHSTFYNLVKAGELPPGLVLGQRNRVWRLSQLNEFLAKQQGQSVRSLLFSEKSVAK